MYKWQQVKTLRAKGVSIKKIARKLKISKNTVRKYLRSSEPPLFKARQYERLLDQYKETIEGMIEKHYIGTRIYNELLQIGYKGSLSSIHRYIAGIKEAEEIKGLATTRVETEPGKQMQYDWKEWHLPVDGKVVKIYIHEVVLSYSRKKYYVSSLSITTEDVIRAIYRAIEFFRGLTEELVIDNPKQMVIIHKNNGTMRYNDEFLRFCGLYGIQAQSLPELSGTDKGQGGEAFLLPTRASIKGS